MDRALITVGVAVMTVALGWWWTSRPSAVDVNTARSLNYLGVQREIPTAEVVGPAVLGGGGAFLVLLGVILLTRRPPPAAWGAWGAPDPRSRLG